MRPATYLTAALLTLAFAPAAQASGPSVAEALKIADRFIGPHQCAGKVQVVMDPTLRQQGFRGLATGLTGVWNGNGWNWFVERCEITLDPNVGATQQCYDTVHEVAHLAHNTPAHDGAMHTDNLNAYECNGGEVYAKASTVKVKKKAKKKRTRAQIARSMRHKRQMAKIRARAAQRRAPSRNVAAR